jgi:hypothetical protein
MNLHRALSILNAFGKAAKKQKNALENGWGHAIFCNFQSPRGNGHGRCNCGVADMLSALQSLQEQTTKEELHEMEWGDLKQSKPLMSLRGRIFSVTPFDVRLARSQYTSHNILSQDNHDWKENTQQESRSCVKCLRYERNFDGVWTPIPTGAAFSTEDILELIKING